LQITNIDGQYQESFGEAAVAYETFRDLHPKHEKIQYALFRIAESYQSDVPSTIARDMASAVKASEGFEEYLRQFPTGEYAEKARKAANELRNQLAEKQLSIAEFYRKRERFPAARGRLERLIQQYPGTPAVERAQQSLKSLPPAEGPSSGT
jgi:outer membrane protein assembly factor BamD